MAVTDAHVSDTEQADVQCVVMEHNNHVFKSPRLLEVSYLLLGTSW